MIAYIEGITVTGERGGWAIASTGANTIVLLGTLTNQAAAAGTVKVYFRETTFHFGAGSEVGITTAADTEKYMPSHADALFSTPVVRDWSWYDPARNGYYSLFPGYTDYRILGCVYYAASTFTHVISYKSGRNKNDNVLLGGPLAAYASSVTAGNYFYGFAASNFKKIWGNDYIISDGSTNGFRITANRILSGRIYCRVTLSVISGADQISLYKNNETTGIFANLNTAGTIQSILSFEDILQAAHFLSFFRDSHALEEYVGSPTFRAEI
jgi:hypothetical protein